MRKHYTKVLKTFLRSKLLNSRAELGISQEDMADRLSMSGRSYVDLEHGETGGGAVTLALFLVYFCEDPVQFQTELREAFERETIQVA